MGEQVPDERGVLAARAVLGPVAYDRGVEVEVAARGEQVGAQGGQTFGARPDVPDRASRSGGAGRGPAAPQVDGHLPVDDHAHRRAHLAALREVRRELLRDLGEPESQVPCTVISRIHHETRRP
ncbi:hypothetical protein GCM10022224_096400 [Nonomuraea antimicrobica]|uniref:Uncharacterized protein n=1 Tax=Nonomuraea antimicrobica TaxID=561173 RepID=A0ABP7E9R6_9ACTN